MAAKRSPSPEKKPKARKRRWYRQLWDVFQMTRRQDPNIVWWLALGFVAVLAVTVVIGLLTEQLLYTLIIGVPTAVLVALVILGRRAERAAYTQIEGQPGAAAAALSTLRRGWTVEKEPVAVDPRTQDMVFRAVGRPGVVLVSEGPATRVGRLLESERRRVARVLPDVPIHLVQLGKDEGQVPIGKLARTVQRQRGKLTPAETAEISKRLKALGAARPPIPKGIDPMRVRPDRKGMRGR
jgi:hypothetical protein